MNFEWNPAALEFRPRFRRHRRHGYYDVIRNIASSRALYFHRSTQEGAQLQDSEMPPAVSRFGPQMLSGPFAHAQQPHVPYHNQQDQAPGSAGLPPPSFNHGFNPNPSSNVNPFAHSTNGNGLAGGFGAGGAGGAGTGLASQAAVMGFAHGAALQQQQQARDAVRRSSGGTNGSKGQMKGRIREVWRGNLAQEMHMLRDLIDDYTYISMDTEFPGIVARPMGAFTSKADYHYQTLRCNVDLLKLIQLGITLFSEDGETPPAHPSDGLGMSTSAYQNNLIPCPCTWQFNFYFSLQNEMYNQDSIDFLAQAGVDLDLHEKNGIEPDKFGALLISSGLVLLEDVKWISFHSGYDFGYLVKLMYCKPLPQDEAEYRNLLNIFFPSIYDIKYMIKHAQRNQTANDAPLTPQAANILSNLGQKSGLQDLADELGIKRVGVAHQAGSDSLLTGRIFWEIRKNIFNGTIDDDKYLGQVWGLNGSSSAYGSTTAAYIQNTQAATEEQSTPNLNGAAVYNGTQGTPSTPGTAYTNPVMSPVQQTPSNGGGIGSLTPGGGGGVFGGFRFGK